jgi:hypothetical protein
MQLPITVTNPLSAPPALVTGRGLPWRTGAVLQAVVLEASVPGRVDLQIGNQTISARTLFALSEGQVLSLRVSHSGELVILRPEDAEQAAKLAATDLSQQALRQALPRQATLPPLLANLTLLVRSPERFPPQLVEAARTALRALPDARSLADPDALAEHVERSGLWLEATLAGPDSGTRSTPALAADWKAALLRLAGTLRGVTAGAVSSGAFERPTMEGRTAQTTRNATASAPAFDQGAPHADASTRAAEASAALLADVLEASAPEVRSGANASTASPEADPPVPPRPASSTASDAAPLLRTSAQHPQSRVAASLAQVALAASDAFAPADHVLKQVEGALARLELGQLASLRSDDASGPMWLLELPVRSPDGETDVLQLRIEQEASGAAEDSAPVWAVSLAFDLAELGPMRARIAVRGEQVSTLFFAERETTVARVRTELGDLEDALSERGLRIGSLGCRAGVPARSSDPPQDGQPLLEVEA